MREDLAAPLLIGGGALGAAFLWAHSRNRGPRELNAPDRPREQKPDAPSSPPASSTAAVPAMPALLPGRWVWPVPIWNGRRPVISDGFGSPRPNGRHHEGVDIMYARLASDPYRAGTPNGAKWHVMPNNMVALAAADGVVWSAGWTPTGFSVVIDHTPLVKVATYYTHMTSLLVGATERARSGERVHAGQPIGIIGADPQDAEHLMHLHLALWRNGPADPVDPAPLMTGWEYIDDPRGRALVAQRNAAPLVYRPVGERGEPYPEWLRNLRGKSGVYVIRERDADGEPRIVYVGESHSGRVFETLTRHFQNWRRWKGYWRGQYGEGHDPGLTYKRDTVEVAVRVLSPNRAIDEEARLIERLNPRDNLLGKAEEVPF